MQQEPAKTEDYIRETVTILFAQQRLIVTSTLLLTAVAVLVSFFAPPIYEVSGSILVKAKKLEKSPEAIEQTQIRLFQITKEDLSSEMELVVNPELVRRTIANLREEKGYFAETGWNEPELTKTINDIGRRLVTELVPSSNIIKLSFTDHDAKLARDLVGAHLAQYLEFRNQIFSPDQVTSFFEKQAKKFTTDLDAKEQQLAELVVKSETAAPEGEISNNLLLDKDLTQQLSLLEQAVLTKRKSLDQIETALASTGIELFSYIDNIPINEFSVKIQDMLIERQKQLGIFQPDSSRIRTLNEQIDTTLALLRNEVGRYADNLASQLAIEEEKVEMIRARLAGLRRRNVELNGMAIEMGRLTREIGLLKQSYEIFTKRWEEAKINASSEASSLFSISVIGEPFFNGKPVFPNKIVLIPFGLLVGLFTGITLGFLREYFDHSIKKPEDIRRHIRVPVLFSLPRQDT
ncbi:MAG: Wzz/FepE/Etk N-terminal domain-containing protein [Thermodesulfobacteriota bacterium]